MRRDTPKCSYCKNVALELESIPSDVWESVVNPAGRDIDAALGASLRFNAEDLTYTGSAKSVTPPY